MEWKKIPGFENEYEVNEAGTVRSLSRSTTDKNGRTWLHPGRNLTPGLGKSKTNRGYYFVTLCKNGTTKQHYIHRLVATLFVPNPENKPQVNHKDGNNFNNSVTNLEWVTPRENQLHAHANGLKKNTRRGSKAGLAKLHETDIPHIRALIADGFLNKDIAYGFGVDASIISNIRHGKTWKHVS